MTSNAIAQPTVFNDDVLSRISSFEDAIAAFNEAGVVPESISDYGTGFSVLTDKRSLVNVEMMILDWRFNESTKFTDDSGAPLTFVSAEVVTKHGDKWILNDGGTGIAQQLRRVTESRLERKHPHPQAGLYVKNGLTVSEYTYEDEKGRKTAAETFYLAE